MPSLKHELPLELIDKRPDLAPKLARACGLGLPEGVRAELVSADFTRVDERRADRAVLLRNEHGDAEAVLVVEVQRSVDAEARARWPGKVASAYEDHGCDVYLLVICPDAKVADWADRPVVIGGHAGPGMVLRMVVVPPDGVPRISDVDLARAEPELAVLSVLSHGADPDAGKVVTQAAVDGLISDASPTHGATGEKKKDYIHYLYYLFDLAPEVVQDDMEERMIDIDTENSAAWLRFPPLVKARIKARQEGEAEGWVRGEAKGEAKGEARGEAKGEANAILLVLRRRGIAVDGAREQRIRDCRDASQLENWLLRAATAESASDVFDDENGSEEAPRPGEDRLPR